MIEIPKDLISNAEAIPDLRLRAAVREAYERGWLDATWRIACAALPAGSHVTASPVSVSKRKPPVGAPRWTPQETAVVAPYRHLKRAEYGLIPWSEILFKLAPQRSKKAIEDKMDSLRANYEKQAAKQNSAPPSAPLVPDGQPSSEAEIVDTGGNFGNDALRVAEHQVDGAEATTEYPGREKATGSGAGDEQETGHCPVSGPPPADSESGETGKRDEFKPRSAAGSNPASRTTIPVQPSPQAQIESELNRAVRKSQGRAPLSALAAKPRYEAPLAAGVTEPPLELPDDDKLMGSR